MTKLGWRLFLMCFLLMLANCKKEDDYSFEVCMAPENVYSGYNIIIKGQADLETFGLNNYTKIEASLRMFEVENLSPLNCLQEVTGSLSIGYMDCTIDSYGECNVSFPRTNPELMSFVGLDNLRKVDGSLTLLGNSVKDLKGLSSLNTVGTLFAFSNGNLENLNGAPLLARINNLNIQSNSRMTDFCRLKNVEISGYSVKNNAYNPTKEQLQTDACKAN